MGLNQFADVMPEEFNEYLAMSQADVLTDEQCAGPQLPYKDKFED
jgi:hypothetical protein